MKITPDDLYLTVTVNDVSFRMRKVAGGTFMMGSETGDAGEKPVHSVTVADFWIGEFPVTQALWKAVTSAAFNNPPILQKIPLSFVNNPSFFKGDSRPVESVSWYDVVGNKEKKEIGFLEKINTIMHEKNEKIRFRLPSEAEWEFAARGGNESKGFLYSGSDVLTQVGWFNENSHDETKQVGLKDPNELGLYDMSGNVWEWCEDTWYDNYKGAPNDGSACMDEESSYRVNLGGSWLNYGVRCCLTYRSNGTLEFSSNYLGFRLVASFFSV